MYSLISFPKESISFSLLLSHFTYNILINILQKFINKYNRTVHHIFAESLWFDFFFSYILVICKEGIYYSIIYSVNLYDSKLDMFYDMSCVNIGIFYLSISAHKFSDSFFMSFIFSLASLTT